MRKLIYTFMIMLFARLALAEGIADRREGPVNNSMDAKMVIDQIHKQHGPTAAGPFGSGKHHKGMMHDMDDTKHSMHKYGGLRHQKQYRHLNAHQYKRKVFGGN